MKKRDKRRFSEEIEQAIIELYTKQFLGSKKIGSLLKINPNNIYYVLHLNSIPIRKASFYKKFLINENFFEEINTEEKAYLLGFLLADGYLLKSQWQIKLEIHKEDSYILEKFNNLVYNETRPMPQFGNCVRLAIYNKKMYADLEKLGLHQAKSLTVSMPETGLIPKELMHHFVRGIFDGDGCIYHTVRDCKRKKGYFQITGSKNVIESLVKIFADITGNLVKMYQPKNNNAWEFRYVSPGHISLIYDYLYKDASIFLSRKKEKFKSLFKITNTYARNLPNRT